MLNLWTISGFERRLLARLRKAGAISMATAHPLPPLERAPANWQDRLVAGGLLALDARGRGYVVLSAYLPAVMAWRLGLAAVALVVLAIVGALLVFV